MATNAVPVSASQRQQQQQTIAALEHSVFQMSADADVQRTLPLTNHDDHISHVTSGDAAVADDNR